MLYGVSYLKICSSSEHWYREKSIPYEITHCGASHFFLQGLPSKYWPTWALQDIARLPRKAVCPQCPAMMWDIMINS